MIYIFTIMIRWSDLCFEFTRRRNRSGGTLRHHSINKTQTILKYSYFSEVEEYLRQAKGYFSIQVVRSTSDEEDTVDLIIPINITQNTFLKNLNEFMISKQLKPFKSVGEIRCKMHSPILSRILHDSHRYGGFRIQYCKGNVDFMPEHKDNAGKTSPDHSKCSKMFVFSSKDYDFTMSSNSTMFLNDDDEYIFRV